MGITNHDSTPIPMETMSNTPGDAPPSYEYTPLSMTSPSPPMSPSIAPKTPISPHHSNTVHAIQSPEIPPVPISGTDPVLFGPVASGSPPPVRYPDPKSWPTCDAKFADVILANVILPRLRVGIFRDTDRKSFEYERRTKEDRKARVYRTKYDGQLGFLPSEYKFRFHVVQSIVIQELENVGFRVRRLKIKEEGKHGIKIKWHAKPPKGSKQKERRGCCC